MEQRMDYLQTLLFTLPTYQHIHQQQQYPYLPIPLRKLAAHHLREHVQLWPDVPLRTATRRCPRRPVRSPRPVAHMNSL